MRVSTTKTFSFPAPLTPVRIVPEGRRWRRVIVISSDPTIAVGSSFDGLRRAVPNADAFFPGFSSSPSFVLPPDQPLYASSPTGLGTIGVQISDDMPAYVYDRSTP